MYPWIGSALQTTWRRWPCSSHPKIADMSMASSYSPTAASPSIESGNSPRHRPGQKGTPVDTKQAVAKGEARRLEEDARRLQNWKRWGPYLSERQWATVREDYSPDGRLWESFPYEH